MSNGKTECMEIYMLAFEHMPFLETSGFTNACIPHNNIFFVCVIFFREIYKLYIGVQLTFVGCKRGQICISVINEQDEWIVLLISILYICIFVCIPNSRLY